MSEIIVRFDSEVYIAGDAIHGAVYLKVDKPTSGYGIKVSIKGCESYSYHDIRKLTYANMDEDCVIKNDVTLLDEQLILCMLKDPFAIGHFVFPFNQILPRHLTGSYEQRSWYGSKWEASVSYQITAEVIGSEHVKTCVPFRVSALFLCNHCPTVSAKPQVRSNQGFSSKKNDFSLDVRLDKASYCVGETVKMTTQLSSPETPIKLISVKLLRAVQFVIHCSASSDRAVCPHCNPDAEFFTGSQWKSQKDTHFVWPEDGPTEVWTTLISSDKGNRLSQVPSVFLQLYEDRMGFGLQPSTHGKFIQCHYTLQLEVTLQSGEKQSVKVPLPHIGLQKKTPIVLRDGPSWLGTCTLILPESDPANGKRWSEWDVYRTLAFPTLQLMRSPDTRRRLAGKTRSSPLTDDLIAVAELE